MSRIADSRLQFYEDNIGASNGIMRRIVLLANEIDDPNQLRILREVAERAKRIRDRNILEMQKEKENE